MVDKSKHIFHWSINFNQNVLNDIPPNIGQISKQNYMITGMWNHNIIFGGK